MKRNFLFFQIRFLTLIFALLVLDRNISYSQVADSLNFKNLNEVVVKATRVNEKSGMAYTDVSQKEIKKQNLGQDLPFLLNQLPSVVVTSDAGAGIGYTGIRIRGSDPTRINVTLNGIPYNDSESQGVFWVNMPDFASSVQSIQVQRGVGSSTNGAGAFGGTINVNTLQLNTEPYAEVNASIGSFNTNKTNLLASTGLIKNRFVFDARLSSINSDGFVDRAASDLKSYYLSGGYYNNDAFVRLNVFSGHEVTYQSWYGIPKALAKGDTKGIDDFVSRNFYDEPFKQSMLASGRRFNFYNYENEVDDYTQSHIQLISSFPIGKNWRLNPTLHYTKGLGFFEQFKENERFSKYDLPNIIIGNEEISRTDLIRRKWLDNDFYGAVWSLDYEGKKKLNANFGGGWNKYVGDHFGEIIWARFASESNIRERYYDNTSIKTDFNIYGKLYYSLTPKLNTYLDLQYRSVFFSMLGSGDAIKVLDYNSNFNFFNPKFGLTFQVNENSSAYGSYAKGTKEPSRQDFVDNAPNVPKPEKLHDFEVGYRFNKNQFKTEINGYFMNYQDQLVLTGKINATGDAIRLNVDNSYRAGVEFQTAYNFNQKFMVSANLTLSQNRIREFEEVIPNYDGGPDVVNVIKNSNISFSPSVISGGSISYLPLKNLEISLLPKYVGKQYLDNTSNEDRKLDAFFVNDLRLSYTIPSKTLKDFNISMLVNNLFNYKYESNGYTYSYIAGGLITENFVFPQAGTNFLTAVRIRF